MKRRQRDRLHQRRAAHTARRAGDRPHIVLDREHYPPVKRAHIVPRVYQRAYAIDGQVAAHVDEVDRCVLMAITEAGARSRYYRRVRPTSEAIDDIEASLAFVEDKVAAPLAQVIAGGPLTFQRKAALAQLVGLQMLRGPAFFEHRKTIVMPLLGLLPVGVDSSGGRFL